MNEKKNQFLAEAEELIAQAEARLLDLTERFTPDSLNDLFRALHTLKGNAGVYGFDEIHQCSHRLEELLDALRLGKVAFTGKVIDTIQRGIDLLKEGLTSRVSREKMNSLFNEIEEIIKKGTSPTEDDLSKFIPKDILDVLSEYEEHRLRQNIKDGNHIYTRRVSFGFDEVEDGLKKTIEELKKEAEIISNLPEPGGIEGGKLAFKIVFATKHQRQPSGSEELLYRPEPSQQTLPESIRSRTEMVRVNISKIDALIEQVEHMRLISERMSELWLRFKQEYGYHEDVFELYKLAQELKTRSFHLQDVTLSLRMVPVIELFERLAQVARKYARQLTKKISIHIEGADTEIDKTVMEEVADPLMHIVRNAIDHGIEDPSERLKKGKPETGNLYFRARTEGPFCRIEIEDDGGGIKREAIRRKAIERGLLPDGVEVSDEDLLSFIFHPGFSTKDKTTEVSGRGVGMDVVKAVVGSIGGKVEVFSEEDRYTNISISVPVTLTLARVLIVAVEGLFYGIPLESISFSQEANHSVQWVEGKPVLPLDSGQVIPVVSLKERFFNRLQDKNKGILVVVRAKNSEMALQVDEIIGTQRVLIRPFTGYLREVKNFTGVFETRNKLCLLIEPEVLDN